MTKKAEYIISGGIIMNQETKFCLSCGKETPIASDYCPYCGKKQVSLEKQQLHTSKQPKTIARAERHLWYKNWMVWAIITLRVGLVTCIALLSNARTTVVMQPAASSRASTSDAIAKKKRSK